MKDRKASKRWEMCVVCGARVCCEVGRMNAERGPLREQRRLTSSVWLKIGQASLELLRCLLCSSLKFTMKSQGLH